MFEFATAQRIRFGRGVAREAAAEARSRGSRWLVVTGSRPERAAWLVQDLAAQGVQAVTLPCPGEPDLDRARLGAALCREAGCQGVLALGGGSALDLGKAVGALAPQPEDLMAYLEVVGAGRPLAAPPLPFIAIPTTAGTGAEVTRNAVLIDPLQQVKVSLRSPAMLPTLALVDPLLTLDLSPAQTAACGLDALAQVLEPFVSPGASPLTDGFCREGLARVGWALPRAVADGSDLDAREAMSLVSLFSGLALANGRLGAIHGFAAPLGGRLRAPHGVLCARLMPEVWSVNTQALRDRSPQHPSLARYQEAAARLTGRPGASLAEGAQWLRNLADDFGIPRLRDVGLVPELIPGLCAQARRASSMKGNPLELDDRQLAAVLNGAR